MNTWELTEEDYNLLPKFINIAYDFAIKDMEEGPNGGPDNKWDRGVERLLALGWKLADKDEGNRSYVHLIAPPNYKHPVLYCECNEGFEDRLTIGKGYAIMDKIVIGETSHILVVDDKDSRKYFKITRFIESKED